MWISACPEGVTSRLPDALVLFGVRWRLGLPLPRGTVVGRCICGHSQPDPYGRHAGNCRWGGGRQLHHDYIATTLRLILAEAEARPFPKEVMLRSLWPLSGTKLPLNGPQTALKRPLTDP